MSRGSIGTPKLVFLRNLLSCLGFCCPIKGRFNTVKSQLRKYISCRTSDVTADEVINAVPTFPKTIQRHGFPAAFLIHIGH